MHSLIHRQRPRPITLYISTDTRDPAFSNRHPSSGPTVGNLWTFPSEISCKLEKGTWEGGTDRMRKLLRGQLLLFIIIYRVN